MTSKAPEGIRTHLTTKQPQHAQPTPTTQQHRAGARSPPSGRHSAYFAKPKQKKRDYRHRVKTAVAVFPVVSLFSTCDAQANQGFTPCTGDATSASHTPIMRLPNTCRKKQHRGGAAPRLPKGEKPRTRRPHTTTNEHDTQTSGA